MGEEPNIKTNKNPLIYSSGQNFYKYDKYPIL